MSDYDRRKQALSKIAGLATHLVGRIEAQVAKLKKGLKAKDKTIAMDAVADLQHDVGGLSVAVENELKSKKAAAGRNFEMGPRSADRHLFEAMDSLKTLSGLLYYRIRGEGSRNDVTGDRFLDDKQKREAEAYEKELEAAKKAIDEAGKKLDALSKKGKSLDSFMSFM